MPMVSCWTISKATLALGAMPSALVRRSETPTATDPLTAGTFLGSTPMGEPDFASTSTPTSGARCLRCQGPSTRVHDFTMPDLSSCVCRHWTPSSKPPGSRICELWVIRLSACMPRRTMEDIEVQRLIGWPSYVHWRSWMTTCHTCAACRGTCTLHSSPVERRAART